MNTGMVLLLVDLIDLARLAVTQGAETARRFEEHRDAVREMVAQNREPSEAERQLLAAEIETLQKRLHEP